MPTTSLTVSQQISLFEILDVPYTDSYSVIDGMGQAYSTVINQPILGAAKQAILSFLNSIGGSDSETKLITYLTEWDSIGLNVGRIESGGASDLQGLNYSWDEKRNLIAKRVRYIVPYYKYHEVLARQQDAQNQSYIPLVR